MAMAEAVKWSILILTMPSRADFLAHLLSRLRPQVEKHPDIEIIVLENTPDLTMLGENRNRLLKMAAGEYVSFVDDDDLVPKDYVNTIYPLLDGSDYVGFRVDMTRDGRLFVQSDHSIKHGTWGTDSSTGMAIRDLSHVNPIRRTIATQVPFSGGVGEDGRWAEQLRSLRVVKTEHYIPRTMYFYNYRTRKDD